MKVIFALISLLLATVELSAALRFVSGRVELRTGESAMLCFTSDESSEKLLKPNFEIIGSEDVIEVLRSPELLPGETTGFLRVRALITGKAVLKIDEEKLEIEVVDGSLSALQVRMRPEFTTPAAGAAVWGEIDLGAEIWVGAPGMDRSQMPEVFLRLPDGKKLSPSGYMAPVDGPFWRVNFRVDCSQLKPGEQEWTLEMPSPADKSGLLCSEPHRVIVLAGANEDDFRVVGECEATLDAPRSERIGSEPPGVGFDQDASDGRYVNLLGYRPEWAAEFDIPEKGSYQLVVVAKGTLAASAYPSLELLRCEDGRRLTAGRLAAAKWHRVALGSPVELEAGKRVLALRLANGMNYRQRVVRQAFIDRFELRRVKSTSSGGGIMMMGGMSMQGMQGRGEANKKAKKNASARGLRVAFTDYFDQSNVNQVVTLRGELSAENFRRDEDYEGVLTALLVNGRPLGTLRGRRPAFEIYPHDLKAGENELQLVSVSAGGKEARSPKQHLFVRGKSHPKQKLATGFAEDQFPVTRGEWKGIKRVKLDGKMPFSQGGEGPDEVLLLNGADGKARTVIHRLPDHFTGDYRISVKARPGNPQDSELYGKLVLHQGKGKTREISIGKITLEPSWEWQAWKRLDLPKGRKDLVIEIAGNAGNVAIGGISLGKAHFVDATAPELFIRYPKPGGQIDPCGDLVIIDAFDDLGISRAKLVIDGQEQGQSLEVPAWGPILLPWDTQSLEPGEHELKVAVWDHSGKRSDSQAVKVRVCATETLGSQLILPFERARRLSQRVGYGADRFSLAKILTEGEDAWLTEQLEVSPDQSTEATVEQISRCYFRGTNDYEVRGRVIQSALLTRYPARMRFVLWAQNHFSTWMAKTGSYAKWREHELFNGAGLARFSDLLLLSTTSPAMMVYLDQQNSLGKQLNENYAREILELHTVGVGAGYSQSDVTALAHLLTGWGAQREATMNGSDFLYRYRFAPVLNEVDAQQVFGLQLSKTDPTASSDDRIIQLQEMLTSRPETAAFICDKLAKHYLVQTSEELQKRLQTQFLESRGDFSRLIDTIARSDELMLRRIEPKFLQPVEFGIARQRSAGVSHPWSVINLGDRAGRNLFDRASPDGYSDNNADYAGSNFQLQKWRYAKELEGHWGNLVFWPWCDLERLNDPAQRFEIENLVSMSVLRCSLSEKSRAALKRVIEQASSIKDHNQRRQLLATFVLMLPEAQVR